MARLAFNVYHEPNGDRARSTLVWVVAVDDDYDLNEELETLRQRDLSPNGLWTPTSGGLLGHGYRTDLNYINDEGKIDCVGWIELYDASPEQARKWIDEIGHELDNDSTEEG